MTTIARETCTRSPVTRRSSLLRGPLCARRAVQEPPRGRLCLASPPAPCSVPSCPHTLLWGVVPPEESVSWAGPSEKCGGHWAGPTPASRWLWGQRAGSGRRRRLGGFGDSGPGRADADVAVALGTAASSWCWCLRPPPTGFSSASFSSCAICPVKASHTPC